MSFTVRKAIITDAPILFKMIEAYHNERNILNKPFTNTEIEFIKTCFNENTKIYFYLSEFDDNILGYVAYSFSYSILKGESMTFNEMFVKKEYRKIGVSTFLNSKAIDIAFDKKCYSLNWVINITDKKLVEIEEKIGININKDTLILNIYKENIKNYVDKYYKNDIFEVRLVKTYELPDVFECVKKLALDSNKKLHTDIYKLMADGFTKKQKFKIFVGVVNNDVTGFMSFYDSYSTSSGKTLIVDQVFVKSELRLRDGAKAILSGLLKYAYDNDYSKVETSISKYEVTTIERLKEMNIFPYKNLRVATYKKEDYEQLYNTK